MTLLPVSFFYTVKEVESMVIYIDLIFFINFFFDFSLLLSVDVLLKRRAKLRRISLGALFGELSMVTLFYPLKGFTNFLFKIGLGILMTIGAFSYRDIRYTFYNGVYLYLSGTILGGFEYYLYNEFQISSAYSFKFLLLIVLSPLVLFAYYKSIKKFKNNYSEFHKVKILYDGNTFEGTGFLDSGNKLVSPISGKTIILVEKEYIIYHKLKLTPIPYNALNHHGLLYCFNPDSVFIDDKKYEDLLIGLSEVKFNIDGCNALLNARMENI